LKSGPRDSKWLRRLAEFPLPQSVVGEGRVRVPDTLQALVHALFLVSILFRSGSYPRFSTRRRADCSICTGHPHPRPLPRINVGEGTEGAAAARSESIEDLRLRGAGWRLGAALISRAFSGQRHLRLFYAKGARLAAGVEHSERAAQHVCVRQLLQLRARDVRARTRCALVRIDQA